MNKDTNIYTYADIEANVTSSINEMDSTLKKLYTNVEALGMRNINRIPENMTRAEYEEELFNSIENNIEDFKCYFNLVKNYMNMQLIASPIGKTVKKEENASIYDNLDLKFNIIVKEDMAGGKIIKSILASSGCKEDLNVYNICLNQIRIIEAIDEKQYIPSFIYPQGIGVIGLYYYVEEDYVVFNEKTYRATKSFKDMIDNEIGELLDEDENLNKVEIPTSCIGILIKKSIKDETGPIEKVIEIKINSDKNKIQQNLFTETMKLIGSDSYPIIVYREEDLVKAYDMGDGIGTEIIPIPLSFKIALWAYIYDTELQRKERMVQD